MTHLCSAPAQYLPSFFNGNYQRSSFIDEATDLLARHDGSHPDGWFESQTGLDWAIDLGYRPWLEPGNVPHSWCGHEPVSGDAVRGCVGDAWQLRDQRVAGFEHALEAKRALRGHSITQGIVRENDLETRRLAMIPFCLVMRAIGAHDTVPGRYFIPKLRRVRARPPN